MIEKQADADLNYIPSMGIGPVSIPETTYLFTVLQIKLKGLKHTTIIPRKFTVKANGVGEAWSLLEDMLWAEDLPHCRHEVSRVEIFTEDPRVIRV